ncbi:hypothetical protein GUITHDRAFT_146984 [Guillardia theta CCMP2712]|uniref:Pseudouridine synthase RsuA/RluA-like domain-containing protein n=1 Tax=Guillardia theta (strain CCMP2712) TaxID=905079 RepID=L1IFF4_GUITC|nr:hypothetical protein GUITHDRAFT_146984 [Guillardia theta CCMP2712]EKX34777.1 hypothetical protein GUITHDRAFT_146984 [Guillardia theta CCMP2712]|eukprot:XP_005821757.1 hypothetical protein GUITHDRAFT_146984 [Guillardia theta CCMP2712]
MEFAVGEEEWQYRTNVYVVLNKPAGYECSNKPSAHASIFELFPEQFQVRGVQSVGRLDQVGWRKQLQQEGLRAAQDTTGMLLLSDDAVTPELVDSLSAGVELKDEPGTIVTPTAVKQLEETLVELSLTEGKYHQVKRMIAACGNRVEKLHRASIAGMELPAGLEEGGWKYLTEEEVKQLLSGHLQASIK